MIDSSTCAASQIDEIRKQCEIIKPLVAVRCTTYNHELYVRDALDGFVKQKTNFPFVVLIHDDASTDNTVEIIKEYQEKYPDLFQCVFEDENLYSQPRPALGNILAAQLEASNAKYIAWCEGDDYWTDPNKLQMQFDFMQSHPDFSMCVTNGRILDVPSGKIVESCHKFYEDQDLSMEDMILGDGSYLFTNTFFCRTNLYFKYIDILKLMYVGDYPTQIIMRHLGKVRMINKPTAIYRQNAVGSWSSKHAQSLDKVRAIEMMRQHEIMLRTLDLLSEYNNSEIFEEAIHHKRLELNLRSNMFKDARYEWTKIKNKGRYDISTWFDLIGMGRIYTFIRNLYRFVRYGTR